MGSIEDFLSQQGWSDRRYFSVKNTFQHSLMFRKDGGGRVQSTLIETVSINYEDFNESFLTCSTCLCNIYYLLI